MKLLLLCLGFFVLGVFVGARMWVALLFCLALAALWWFGPLHPPPDRFPRSPKPFGRGPRDPGR